MAKRRGFSWWQAVGPGLLVAATGVGAGDLATGAIAGRELGVAVLWAVLVGAFLKFVLTEGLARYQIATGDTLLEGALSRLSRPWRFLFLVYLLPWSFFVGAALISACGVALHALVPVFESASTGKVVWGIACSVVGVVLVELGGYRVFERVMRVCIGLMFVTTCVTAAWIAKDWGEIGRGLCWPTIDTESSGGLDWTLALIGGVGGTLTILCYGYWIREEGRDRREDLALCRVDLGIGYLVTAAFGIAIVIIGDQVDAGGVRGARLVVLIGERLGESLGQVARWLFLIGAFGAVFSSLLGVWQSVPQVFADFWQLAASDKKGPVDPKGRVYRGYLLALAFVPMIGVGQSFEVVQKTYAILGAAFLPLLAAVLLWLNGRRVSAGLRNRPVTSVVLWATLVFFTWIEFGRRSG